MNWVDVAGTPGIGKSTLCDPLWGGREMPLDEGIPPARWHDFINEITRLMYILQGCPSIDAAVRMNRRSMRKMSNVAKSNILGESDAVKEPYVQTGFVQRGLGFGWRLNQMGMDVNEIRHFFWLMPVSIGVVFLECDPKVVIERNHARKLVPETAHEDRAYQVPLVQHAIRIAKEVLEERGVDVAYISTEQPIEDARSELIAFANHKPDYVEEVGPRGEVAALSPPIWYE